MVDNSMEWIEVARPQVGEEEVLAVNEVLRSGNYISGKRVDEFEKSFSEYIGVEHAVAVNSGTAALYIALDALGVKKGDEVIAPPLTFFATISSILYLGAVPVFADIDLDDLCISPSSVESCITPETKAILPVHLFGGCAKMDDLMELSETYDVPIIEDCAQAHGTEYRGKTAGSFGKAGAFSFFATKHMTTGEGGMITTNDAHLAEQAKIIRSHGMTDRDDHVRLGFNSRMTEMEAAMGLIQLKKLDELNEKRIDNSRYLIRQIKHLPWLRVPASEKHVKHTYFWCPVLVDGKMGKSIEDLKMHLRKNNIGFRERYKEPLYKQKVLRKVGLDYSHLRLTNAEFVAGSILGLPNHPTLSKQALDRIINVLEDF